MGQKGYANKKMAHVARMSLESGREFEGHVVDVVVGERKGEWHEGGGL
jgi:hypothetical protein